MTREESLALATAARKARLVSAVESRARFTFVERLLVNDVSPREIVRRCRERFGMSVPAVERVKTRVFEAWAAHDAELRELRKAQQRRRLLRVIRTATKGRMWRAVVAGEALLAKIDGTIETEARRDEIVTAGQRPRDLLWQALQGMTDAEIQALAGEEGEPERAAH